MQLCVFKFDFKFLIFIKIMKTNIFSFLIVLGLCFYLTTQQAKCVDNNCQLCTNSTSVCDSCVPGYTNDQGFCIECKIQKCQTCDTANNCVSCMDKYSLYQNICYSCDIPNCKSCRNNNYCWQCNRDTLAYSPSSNGDSCVLCDVMRCSSCQKNNSCGICQNYFQLYTLVSSNNATKITKCVICQVKNCITCSDDNKCGQCIPGYQMGSDGQCFKCNYPCQTCNASQTCATCQTPFYAPLPNSDGVCLVNKIPHCLSFQYFYSSNTTACNSCQKNYKLNDADRSCQPQCLNPCLTCSSSNGSSCNSCGDGYFLNSNKCVPCSTSGCKRCPSRSNTCQECSKGYYLYNSQCKKCPSFCQQCTNANTCTKLTNNKGGYIIFINSQGNTILALCASTCQSCSTTRPQECLQCRQSYYLNNGKCSPCNKMCRTCSKNSPNTCLSCYPFAELEGNTCVTCSSNCLSCQPTNRTACKSCRMGQYLSNSKCVPGCAENCNYCSDQTKCTQCRSGYTLFSDQDNNQVICVQCMSNCRTCVQGQPDNCLVCGDGFYDKNQECIACSEITCKKCSQLGCQECVQGNYLTDLKTCAKVCSKPCATCSTSDTTQCQSCIAGYTFSSTTLRCIPTLICTGPCSICPLGYTLNMGKCLQCSTANCQSCDSNDAKQCESCMKGYYLDISINTCVQCTTGCAACAFSDACSECTDGYTTTQTSISGTAGFSCSACKNPCKTCQKTIDRCLSCVDGYQINGWKCIKQFRFGFGLTLLADKITFYKFYSRFLKALARAINGKNKNTDIVTINVIRFGSVIIEGSVDPSSPVGEPDSLNQYSNLVNALAANGQMGSMQIASSSVNIKGGSISPSSNQSESNLGLILGITIPIGVLLLLGLGVFLYLKGRKIKENAYEPSHQDQQKGAYLSNQNLYSLSSDKI